VKFLVSDYATYQAVGNFVIDSFEVEAMSPISKIEIRRLASRHAAKELLQSAVTGETDVYLAYRGLYRLWCSNNAALQELRPLFRIDGIEPDGCLSVTDEFREQVRTLARQILPHLPD
jgi:hypothetical protein